MATRYVVVYSIPSAGGLQGGERRMTVGVGTGPAGVHSRIICDSPNTASVAAPADEPSVDFPELECVRALLPSDGLDTAAARAALLGTGADRVLIASGAIGEETYLRALPGQLGVVFEPLDGVPRAMCPIEDDRLTEAAGPRPMPGGRPRMAWPERRG